MTDFVNVLVFVFCGKTRKIRNEKILCSSVLAIIQITIPYATITLEYKQINACVNSLYAKKLKSRCVICS
jgi:hypothetical protein